ncbi:MAG: hypothetical protein IAE95_12625 [Chitinophagaceae bacterium]|nr:hypothetical protein [Chitinophagaceae bacterium]
MIFSKPTVLGLALLASVVVAQPVFGKSATKLSVVSLNLNEAIGVNDINDTIFTDWQNLSRPSVKNHFCCFYRFGFSGGEYFLDLKVSVGGVKFIVAKNAMLEIEMECGDTVKLYNTKYEKSCRGCGAIWKESDVHGVTLRFPMTADDLRKLAHDYPGHVRLHLPENVVGSYFTIRRTELFKGEVDRFMEQVGLR